jgi:hypothetical protein
MDNGSSATAAASAPEEEVGDPPVDPPLVVELDLLLLQPAMKTSVRAAAPAMAAFEFVLDGIFSPPGG